MGGTSISNWELKNPVTMEREWPLAVGLHDEDNLGKSPPAFPACTLTSEKPEYRCKGTGIF